LAAALKLASGLKKSRPRGAASDGALGEKWWRQASLREGEKLGCDHHTGTKDQKRRNFRQLKKFDVPGCKKLTRLNVLMIFLCV
jgi:hypothetical protein